MGWAQAQHGRCLGQRTPVIVQEADQPDVVIDFRNTYTLASEHGAEMSFTLADANAPASSHAHRSVVERVFSLSRWHVFSRRWCIDVAWVGATERASCGMRLGPSQRILA